MSTKQIIITQTVLEAMAREAGITLIGASGVSELTTDGQRLKDWLIKGMHGEMSYMERHMEKRINPALLVAGARTVISIAEPYNINPNDLPSSDPPRISRYALVSDYHAEVKHKLLLLHRLLSNKFGEIEGRAFVDSAPVLERAWAVKAGLGWIGKNGLLINKTFGSYLFIGQLIVSAEVEWEADASPSRCGSCTRCMDACPSSAIVEPRVLDARRCISYLTIEKKGALSADEQKMLSGWCFGCDICQEVCPWNHKAATQCVIKPIGNEIRLLVERLKTGNMEPKDWKKQAKGTALERVSPGKMRMNLGLL